MPGPEEITRLLVEHRNGNRDALDRLLPLVYDELRKIAARYLRSERQDHTLQPTALVHEAYMRLADQRNVDWRNRAQFLGIAAQIMRRMLVDHARGRNAGKRGSGATKLSIDEALDAAVDSSGQIDVQALDEALERLAELDEQQSKIVELRYFGGLSVEETAQVLGVSAPTVKRDWAMARAWLKRQLEGTSAS